MNAQPLGPAGPQTPAAGGAAEHHFPRLDGLRGLAAAAVFVYHANHVGGYPVVLSRLAGHANSGVALFFLLSGFLIYRPFVLKTASGRPLGLRRFYWRRAARVFPAYWFALFALAAYPGLIGFGTRWWQLLSLTQIYDPTTTMAGIGAAWSLCIEVSFYFTLPLYVVAIRRWRPTATVELATLATLAAASVGTHLLITHYLPPNLSYTLPGTFYLFATGMAIAVVSVWTRWLNRLERWQNPLLVAALAIYVVESFVFGSLGSVHLFFLPGATLLFLTGVLRRPSWSQRLLMARPLAWFGTVSYAFYLWHMPVLMVLHRWLRQPALFTLTAFVVTLAISALSWYGIERPLLRLAAAQRRPSPLLPEQPEQPEQPGQPGQREADPVSAPGSTRTG